MVLVLGRWGEEWWRVKRDSEARDDGEGDGGIEGVLDGFVGLYEEWKRDFKERRGKEG